MKVFRAAAVIGLLAAPAYAQSPETPVPGYGEPDKDKTLNQIQQAKEAEKAYKNSLSNVPNQGPVDPWGNTRNVGQPKASKAGAKTDPKVVSIERNVSASTVAAACNSAKGAAVSVQVSALLSSAAGPANLLTLEQVKAIPLAGAPALTVTPPSPAPRLSVNGSAVPLTVTGKFPPEPRRYEYDLLFFARSLVSKG